MKDLPKLRILHVITDPATGWFLVKPIAQRQAQAGYVVEFASGSGEYAEKLEELGFSVHFVKLSRSLVSLSHFRALIQLVQLMRQRQYHIVHTHTPVASFLGRIAAAIAGSPIIIYHMRGSWWDSPSVLLRSVFTTLEYFAGKLTSHTFTINCTDASELVARGISRSEDVTCLHCGSGGVSLRRFSPELITAARSKELRAEHGLSDAQTIVGFVGRFVREKGIFELMTAFKVVLDEFPQTHLLLVGGTLASERDQKSMHELKYIVEKDVRVQRHVHFTGFREDVPDLVSIMDIVVLPSYREGFGMVLAEAAAMGKPTVTTDTRGGREAVIHEITGFHVPIRDEIALAKAISALCSDRDKQRRMGTAGRLRAVDIFSEDIVFSAIDSVYRLKLEQSGLVDAKHPLKSV